MVVGVRHPDFEKIHAAFMQHYSKNVQLVEERYSGWVKDSNLDESQSYYLQGAQRAAKTKQNFDWAKLLMEFIKEDTDAYYYKVEALFPVESMNKDTPPFTRDEVLQSARSLTGKPSDLNHDHTKMLEGVEVTAAQFEDDCVECVVRVPKTSILVGMIQRKEIVSVSIEGEWSHGIPGQGLVLTGLGWLTKETMLPGIPLTRIMPVEQIAETFRPVQSYGVEKLEEKDIDILAEKVAAKIGGKDTAVTEQLKVELEASKKLQSEAESKVKVAEELQTKINGDLSKANKVIEGFKKAAPGVDLLAMPPVLMPVSEHIAVLERLVPSVMVERSTMGMQVQGQKVRAELLKAKEKLRVK
jgi:hypothetical protein